jgi:hypothetical protein
LTAFLEGLPERLDGGFLRVYRNALAAFLGGGSLPERLDGVP